MRARVAHISMQFSDTRKQQRQDARRVFARAKRNGFSWVTGTEANIDAIAKIIRKQATKHGFRFVRGGGDVWVAVREDRIKKGWDTSWTKVVSGGSHGKARWPARGILRASWVDKYLGQVTVLVGHYQTQGVSKAFPDHNKRMAQTIGDLARHYGKGQALVFYHGDQNLNDAKHDTFMGQPLTSTWDELGKWPSTGKGFSTIDVIASYNRGRRVKAVGAWKLDDSKLPLHTDHYLVVSEFEVAPLQETPKPKPVKFEPPSPPVVGGTPRNHSGRTNLDKPLKRIVIHSAVAPCKPGMARTLGRLNQTSTSGSWHYATDPKETIQCSWDSYVCWHAPPNPNSIGIEMADNPEPIPRGWANMHKAARQKARQVWRWRKPEQQAMLTRTAKLTAELALAYDVPIEFLSVKKLKAGKRGITTHANVSKAFGQSSHWDPGFWPRAKFMKQVRKHAAELRKG